MLVTFSGQTTRRRLLGGPPVCALALLCLAQAPATVAARLPTRVGAREKITATLEQCVTAVSQAERSATFAGEMTTIAGSARMQMRIDVLERMPGEALFHTVSAPGLGGWRGSAPGVKVYRYLKQVTNLSAPAFYRGAVRFRWLNARGRLITATELRTPVCEQPAGPAPAAPLE
jgi:hypothetical protein